MYFSWHAKLINLLKFIATIIIGLFLLGAILMHHPASSQQQTPQPSPSHAHCVWCLTQGG